MPALLTPPARSICGYCHATHSASRCPCPRAQRTPRAYREQLDHAAHHGSLPVDPPDWSAETLAAFLGRG